MTRTATEAAPALPAPQAAPRRLDWAAPFSALREGDAFTTDPVQVRERDVLLFAALTGDHHPLHVDGAWAARSPLGGQVAHGLLVLGLAAGLVPFDPARIVALRAVREAVFKKPVPIGSWISVSGEVAGLRGVGDEAGVVDLRWAVKRFDGPTVCRARVEVVWAEQRVGDPPPLAPDASLDLPLGVVPC